MNHASRKLFRWCLAIEVVIASALCGCTDVPLWALLQRKAALTDFQHFDNAIVRRSAQVTQLMVSTDASHFLSKMMHPESFDAMMARSGTVAFIVLQHGKIVAENYYNGFHRDSVANSFSMAKSIVSALLGIAIHEKKIASVDQAITDFLPELLKNDPRFGKITIRHLLEMRSGIAFDDREGIPWSDAAIYYLTTDLRAKLAALKIESAPDQAFHYNSGDTALLGLIIQRATGSTLSSYLQKKIWQPMGAEYDASWSLDSFEDAIPKAFCCVNARAIDFARFGLLYLNDGQIDGRQIVPAEWVRASIAIRAHASPDSISRWNIENAGRADAAYFTWHWRRRAVPDQSAVADLRPAPDFYAEGLLGQLIYIAPLQDMVIVRLGEKWGDIPWIELFDRIASSLPR
jgi:CubicO group peptidase (beta-lactamase class C family)